MLARGLTDKEIAQRYTPSTLTVDTYVERALAKLKRRLANANRRRRAPARSRRTVVAYPA